MDKKLFEWTAFEYEQREKTADWYWTVGIVAASIAIIAILLKNPLFAVVIALGAFILGIMSSKEPPLTGFRITHKGVVIGKYQYPYSALASFWIDEKYSDPAKIIIKPRKFLPYFLIMPLPGLTPAEIDDIRDYLSRFIPEHELHESSFQKIMEYLGF